MEFAVLGLFCGILILCIVCNVSIIYALLAGFVIFGCYAKKKGFSVKEILHMAGEGIWKVRNILITFMLIGMLTALWRQAGTIPAIICYTIPFYKTIGLSSDGISFELAGFGADRNFVWDSGNSRRCLCDDGLCPFGISVALRRCDPFGNLFW